MIVDAVYMAQIFTERGGQREKKRKKVDSGAAGDGIGAGARGIGGAGGARVRLMECQGRGRRRAVPSREDGGTAAERRRRGVSGLEAVMVRNKSKTNCAPLSMVLFYMHSNLFCTD